MDITMSSGEALHIIEAADQQPQPRFLGVKRRSKRKQMTTSRPHTFAINVLVLITLSILAYVNMRLFTKIINEYPSRNAGLARTAAICVIQKWGLRYIDEWVDYHLAIGFQTIFIYDNSDDFETLGWYSNKYQNGTDRVEIFHWPGEEQQMKAYDECIRHIQHLQYQNHFWIAFIDLDEFIVIKDIETYPFILDYLETIPPNVGGLTVNWQLFGWSNLTRYEAKPLSLRFNLYENSKVVKTIARTDRVSTMPNPHWARYTKRGWFTKKEYKSVDTNGEIVEGPWNYRMPTDVLAINHYRNKSLAEYTDRCKRGRADNYALQAKDINPACKPRKAILADWENDNKQSQYDDSVWKLLKERVPAYTKYYENR